MGILVAKEMSIDNPWADSEQPKVFTEEMIVNKTTSLKEDLAQEQPFSKGDLRKVSRKVKK